MKSKEVLFYEKVRPYIEDFLSEVLIHNNYDIIPFMSKRRKAVVYSLEKKKLVFVNSLGLRILELCSGDKTVKDIMEILCNEYRNIVDETTIQLDIIKFLRMAKQEGLIKNLS